jgi:hypothetical protein
MVRKSSNCIRDVGFRGWGFGSGFGRWALGFGGPRLLSVRDFGPVVQDFSGMRLVVEGWGFRV